MHLDIMVEEESAEVFLRNFLSKVLPGGHTYKVIVHQGKKDLLDKLPNRLRGYGKWIPRDYIIIVLVDKDNDNCKKLKNTLEDIAAKCGLTTRRSKTSKKRVQIINRIVIEELEAWFWGDIEAIRRAYPGFPNSMGKKRRYSDPDSITGGTWEALLRELQKVGYYRSLSWLPKIEAARSISQHMAPERNRSGSFRVFYRSIQSLIGCLA